MTTTLTTRSRIMKGTYFVDNKTLRLYCVVGFKRNRTVAIVENCRTLNEIDVKVTEFDQRFSEGVKIVVRNSSNTSNTSE